MQLAPPFGLSWKHSSSTLKAGSVGPTADTKFWRGARDPSKNGSIHPSKHRQIGMGRAGCAGADPAAAGSRLSNDPTGGTTYIFQWANGREVLVSRTRIAPKLAVDPAMGAFQGSGMIPSLDAEQVTVFLERGQVFCVEFCNLVVNPRAITSPPALPHPDPSHAPAAPRPYPTSPAHPRAAQPSTPRLSRCFSARRRARSRCA